MNSTAHSALSWRLAAVALALALLPACKASLDGDELVPSLAVGEAAATCPVAGTAATVALSLTETRVVLGAANQQPINHVDVVGTVSGMPAGDVIVVAVIGAEITCPVFASARVVPDAAGRFTAQLDLGNLRELRVVAFSALDDPALAIGCDTAAGCISTSGPAVSGLSGSILVVLE